MDQRHQVVSKFIRSMTQQNNELGPADICLESHSHRGRGSQNILKRLRILDAEQTLSSALTLGRPCAFEIAISVNDVQAWTRIQCIH